MPEFFRTLYTCYLGKNKGVRLQAIAKFVVILGAEWFFQQYSMPADSIKDFLKRVKDSGLELK
jgi:hypothetical protein